MNTEAESKSPAGDKATDLPVGEENNGPTPPQNRKEKTRDSSKKQAKSAQQPSGSKVGKQELFLTISLATTGRSPCDGYIMSLGACAMTIDKKIVGVYSGNMLPLSSKIIGSSDVLGYWRNCRDELEAVLSNAQPPEKVMQGLVTWCKSFGKGASFTLVANPMLTVFGFLCHYLTVCCPELKSPPWGYSGTCAKSFCCGALGLSSKELAKHETYLSWFEGMQLTMIPENDAVVSAIIYANAQRHSLQLPPVAVEWATPQPPLLGFVPPATSPRFDDNHSLPFTRYPSIVDCEIDATLVGNILADGCDFSHAAKATEWVLTEKVHGSNISIITDGTYIRCARRSGLMKLADARTFFSFDLVVSKLEANILALFKAVSELMLTEAEKQNPSLTITLFGEIAGGDYSHPMVPVDIRGHRVQSGVQYSPSNFFYAFDVLLTFSESDQRFLDYDSFTKVVDDAKIMRAQTRFRGSLAEAIAQSPVFTTTMPKLFSLPPLTSDNFAEGVVIRPAHDIWISKEDDHGMVRFHSAESELDVGSVSFQGQARLMFKRKHPKFSEMVTTNAPTVNSSLLEVAKLMLTDARVASVSSKLTAEERLDVDRVAKRLAEDALTDALAFRKHQKDVKHATTKGNKAAVDTKLSPEDRNALLSAAKNVLTSKKSAEAVAV